MRSPLTIYQGEHRPICQSLGKSYYLKPIAQQQGVKRKMFNPLDERRLPTPSAEALGVRAKRWSQLRPHARPSPRGDGDHRITVNDAGPHDGQEIVGLQARAADQAAVDVRLAEQRRGVVRLDAAAVLDRRRGAASSPKRWPIRPRMKAWASWACSGVAFCRCRSPRPARRRARRSPAARPSSPARTAGQLRVEHRLGAVRLRARPASRRRRG